MPKVIQNRLTKAERKQVRQPLGRLHSLQVKSATTERYHQSFVSFLGHCGHTVSHLKAITNEVDGLLSDYIEFLWCDGEPKSAANYVVASVQYFLPECRHRLAGAWRLVSTWNRVELPFRATPATPELMLAIAGIFLQWRWQDVAYMCLVGFSTFLRTGEMFRIRREHVHLPASPQQHAIIFLEDTKTGARKQMAWEKVLVKEKLALDCLKALCRGKAPPERLLSLNVCTFRKLWKDVVQHLGLQGLHLQPYSIRRGGATSAYRRGMTFEELMQTGRWANVSTARIYLDESLQELGTLQIPVSSRTLIQRAQQTFLRCKPGRNAWKGDCIGMAAGDVLEGGLMLLVALERLQSDGKPLTAGTGLAKRPKAVAW